MPRSFTSNFTTAAASKSASPYFVLEIAWGGATGTKYYLDRPSSSFSASGTRCPATIETPLVIQWPAVDIGLNESQIGFTSQTQVILDDTSGAITAILNLEEKQRKLVSIYRMFDDSTVVWGTDNALMLTGILRPFDWTAKDNQITLNLGDLGPLLAKSISFIASSSVFSKVPPETRDKNIPLCWGRAQRVEAVLVSRPWETQILQSVTGSESVTVQIKDHPSDMGITDGSVLDAWLGTDKVSATFHQSATPDTVPSTVDIASTGTSVILNHVTVANYQTGASRYIVFAPEAIRYFRLADFIQVGASVMVLTGSGWSTTTISAVQQDYPWTEFMSAQLADATIMANITPGTPVKFLLPNANTRLWQSGAVLRALNDSYIYAANALPSKQVMWVEGYGTITDSGGSQRKGFIVLGQQVGDELSGGVCVANQFSDPYTVNKNDSTWAGTLGNNITTVTFKDAPRAFNPNLDEDRIWVTLLGVEDAGNGTGNLINNPANIILEYLKNSSLMNVSLGSINTTSFTTAATSLSGYASGFAQLDAMDGLQLLHDLARQCHSCLFFDQGKATIAVLSNSAGSVQHTFDTSTNDNMLQGSLAHSVQSVDDLVNDLNLKWRGFWDDKTGAKQQDCKAIYLTSQSAFGRMSREIPVYMHWRRVDVVTELDFWLAHWGYIWRTVKFTAFLDALILQPGDWISVTWIDGGSLSLFGGAQTMQVTKTTDTGKDGLVELEARYVMFTYS